MDIRVDPLESDEIKRLLTEHLEDMFGASPAESVHALDLTALKQPNITFWSVWENDELLGCGALKSLDAKHAEIKSMRTTPLARGRGVASKLLTHILDHAKTQGFQNISLETGPQDFFAAARKLYSKHGFNKCGPFADYKPDPFSVFMTRSL